MAWPVWGMQSELVGWNGFGGLEWAVGVQFFGELEGAGQRSTGKEPRSDSVQSEIRAPGS